MILVKTKIGSSEIHGIGLFADQFIPKGTVTWQYNPAFDIAFSMEQIAQMSGPAKEQFWKYAYLDKDLNKYVLCFDDQRFINHSSQNPNISSTPHQDVAARDINPGEEMLCDYDQYDDTYFTRTHLAKEELK